MASNNQGRDEFSGNSDSSTDSSESLESYSERSALLQPNSTSSEPNYKSTGIINTEESQLNEVGPVEDQPVSNNVVGIISLLLIGVIISNADSTLVLATYGTIASEFGSLGDATWLTTSFSLAICAAQPISGKLSDIYGRKAVLLVSYFLFGLGAVGCGIAQSMGQVILGRIVSGLGASGMSVIVSILITDLVPLIQVASWRSYVNVAATLGRSIGGPLGGLLADTIGWRWSFTGQGPLILLAIILVAFGLPSTKSEPLPPAPHTKAQPSKLKRIDFIGAFMLAITIVALLGALSLGGQNLAWSDPIVVGLLLGSLILGSAFVFYEVEYAVEPIFPPSLIVRRDVATAYAVGALQGGAQTSMMYTIPLYLRATQNSSNTVAGSHLFPAVVGNTIGALVAGFIIQKTGRYRFLTLLATASSSLTYLLLILFWDGRKPTIFSSLFIVPGGFGTGMAFSATFIALTSSVKHKEMATATGGMYLANSVGMVVTIAAVGSVIVGSLGVLLRSRLKGFEGADLIIENVMKDVGSISGLEETARKVVVECYVKSLEYSHMVSLGCSVAAFAIASTIREHSLK